RLAWASTWLFGQTVAVKVRVRSSIYSGQIAGLCGGCRVLFGLSARHLRKLLHGFFASRFGDRLFNLRFHHKSLRDLVRINEPGNMVTLPAVVKLRNLFISAARHLFLLRLIFPSPVLPTPRPNQTCFLARSILSYLGIRTL